MNNDGALTETFQNGFSIEPDTLIKLRRADIRYEESAMMNSPVIKRSVVIGGRKTSVSLEDAFWKGLKEIAIGRGTTLSTVVATIDADRRHGNLSSAIRMFVLDFYRSRLTHEMGAQSPSLGAAAGGAGTGLLTG